MVKYFDILWLSLSNFLDIFSYVSCWSVWIFCRISHRDLPRYSVGSHMVNSTEIFWAPYGQLCNFVGYLTVNFLHILSLFHGQLCRFLGAHQNWTRRYFVGWHTLNTSHWIISIFCLTSHCEYSRYFAGCLLVNYIHIFRRSHCEESQHFVGHLAVHLLAVSCGVS